MILRHLRNDSRTFVLSSSSYYLSRTPPTVDRYSSTIPKIHRFLIMIFINKLFALTVVITLRHAVFIPGSSHSICGKSSSNFTPVCYTKQSDIDFLGGEVPSQKLWFRAARTAMRHGDESRLASFPYIVWRLTTYAM